MFSERQFYKEDALPAAEDHDEIQARSSEEHKCPEARKNQHKNVHRKKYQSAAPLVQKDVGSTKCCRDNRVPPGCCRDNQVSLSGAGTISITRVDCSQWVYLCK